MLSTRSKFGLCSLGLLLLSLILWQYMNSYSFNQSSNIEYISQDKAQTMVSEVRETLLIDVRTEAEYTNSHLEGAVNIPMRELNESLTMLDAYKDKTLILYCNDGSRSLNVAKQLEGLGYQQIYVIKGKIK